MAFVKKEVDIEALMAAAALEEAKPAEPVKAKKEKKKKKEKKEKKEKKDKPKREKSKKSKKKGKRPAAFNVPIAYEGEDGDELPKIFSDLVAVLEDKGTEHEGLFRKTASTVAVEELIARYEGGEDIEWEELEDFHLVGGVLMAYLLKLPEPLITFDSYDVIMRYHSNNDGKEQLTKNLKKAVLNLPEINYEMLDSLLDFLDTMTRDAEESMMTADNLAICFGPALMHRREENLGQLMKEAQLVTDTITLLIEHYGFVFRDEELNMNQAKGGVSAVVSEEVVQVDIKEFITKAKENLEIVVSRLQKVLGELEFSKLWNEESTSYLAVIIFLLEQSLQQVSMDADSIRQAVRSQFGKHNGMAKAQGVSVYCGGLKNKLTKATAAFSEHIYKLNQAGISQSEVLTSLAVSKSATAIIDELGSQIQHESSATATDMNLIITLGPIVGKQIMNMKAKLEACNDVSEAVVLSRVVRAAQKSLKERIQTPLESVDRTPGTSSGNATKDKRKIETLCDTLEFCYPGMKKVVNAIEQEAQDPSKQNDTVRNAQLMLSLYNFLYEFAPVKAPPGLVGNKEGSGPPPVAPHPSRGGGPPPSAPHPSRTNSGPPPTAPHPSRASTGPPPTAPHPSRSNGPPPTAPHPSQRSGPPPTAPHPSQRQAPPPVAAHPSSRSAPPPTAPHPSQSQTPPPVAAHPSQRKAPPPTAAHPRSAAPPPMAAHPSASAPPPVAAHPSKATSPRPKPPSRAGWIPAARPIKPRPHDNV